ncbi:hypothetical protein [Deinococcus koreensis]|uniref:Uncharacterized protein n=1 Tax=Deinococcus koreensis TaxID=2054903 RepID=A0A2K3UZQ1_9DEIO|nr:hypothetical protein [Deinococcus koreensis]PNY82010.1 hypothetical protein CVO96_12095 [Deinococcus koreensis]
MTDFPSPATPPSAQAQAVLDVIRRRRTVDITALRPGPLPRGGLEAILEAGTWAPTYGLSQP